MLPEQRQDFAVLQTDLGSGEIDLLFGCIGSAAFTVDGLAMNKNRIAKNDTHFLSVVDDIKYLLPAGSEVNPNGRHIIWYNQ